MPNHCQNSLIVRGPQTDIAAFKEKAVNPDDDGKPNVFDIGQFIPMPDELRSAKSPPVNEALAEQFLKHYGARDWYDWAIVNWGTKWGAYDSRLVYEDNDVLEYEYATAWSPLLDEVIVALSKKFPTLEFESMYAEQGIGFWGMLTAKDGDVMDMRFGNLEFRFTDEDELEGEHYDPAGTPLPECVACLAAYSG